MLKQNFFIKINNKFVLNEYKLFINKQRSAECRHYQ